MQHITILFNVLEQTLVSLDVCMGNLIKLNLKLQVIRDSLLVLLKSRTQNMIASSLI
jgi:hypothetical protein